MDKKKMRKILYLYIVLILILLFFSKTVYNFSPPKVSVMMPESGALDKRIEAYGEIQFAKTYEIYAQISGQVQALYAEEKDSISPMSAIALIVKNEEENTQDDYIDKTFEVRAVQNELSALELDRQNLLRDKERIQNEVGKDNTSYFISMEGMDRSIETQRNTVEQARALLDAGALSSTEYEKERNTLSVLENEKKQKEAAHRESQQETQEKNDDTLQEKEDALLKLSLSIDDAKLKLDKAIYNRDKQYQDAKDKSSIEKAQVGGHVLSIDVQKNSFVSQGQKLATIGVPANDYIVEISCKKEEGEFISIGDTAEINYSGLAGTTPATVSEIKPEGEHLKLKLSFASEDFKGGEYAKIKIEKRTQEYRALVPSEAIITEGFNNFIWVIRSRGGALGTEYYSVKLKVLIADSDDTHTAISKGLEYFEPVVISVNKELLQGERVIQMD